LDVGFNNPSLQKRPNTRYICARIDEIATTYNGGTPSKSEASFWNGIIPWVSPKDFIDIAINDSEDHITQKAIDDTRVRILPIGTVLVVYRSGILLHTLPVAMTKVKLAINQDIKALILDKRVLPEYFVFYFHVFGQRLLPIITKHSTTVQSINSEQFNALLVPTPPLSVQHDIITKMEKAWVSRRQKLEEADALLTSLDTYLLDRLGLISKENSYPHYFAARLGDAWNRSDPDFHSPKFKELRESIENSGHPVKSVQDICIKLRTGFAAGRENQAFDEIQGIPHIRPLNISAYGNLSFDGTKYIPKDSVDEKELIGNGEVLLNNTNSTIWVGKSTVFEDERPCCCSNHITRLTVDSSKVLPWYLALLFNAIRSTGYFGLLATNFVNQAGINTETLSALRIPIPDLGIQKEIVDELFHRRTEARRLHKEAEKEWATSKEWFEKRLLNDEE